MIEMIQDVMQHHPVAYWEQRLKDNEVPCSPINTVDKVVAQPQVQARNMIEHIELEGLGMMSMAGLPIKFSETPGAVRLPPARLGQHTAEILGQIGYDAARIEALATSGAIGLDKGWVPVTGGASGGA